MGRLATFSILTTRIDFIIKIFMSVFLSDSFSGLFDPKIHVS